MDQLVCSKRINLMGYSETRHIIQRNWPQLSQLIKHKATMRFDTEYPRRLAFKLREARKACSCHEDHEEDFATLSLYTFKEERDGVLAEYNPVPIGVPLGKIITEVVGEPVKSRRIAPNALSLIDVMSEFIGNDKIEEIHFPNAILTEDNKLDLHSYISVEYADGEEVLPPWLFIDHDENGITLTRYEVDSDILWSPENASTI